MTRKGGWIPPDPFRVVQAGIAIGLGLIILFVLVRESVG